MGKEAHRLSGLVLLVLALMGPTGCFGGDEGGEARTFSARVIERDFSISAPKQLPAGRFELAVQNRGPVAHELLIVRSANARLPIGADGTSVDEEAIKSQTVAEIGPVDPGDHKLEADLQPGSYVLICNMTGHYMGGMHSRLRVQ